MARLALLTVMAIVTGACAAADPSSEPTAPQVSRNGGGVDRPPPVIVRGDGVELSLQAYTACWGNACFDGAPPEVLPDIGSPRHIEVEFPESGWGFSATVQPLEDECGRQQTEPLERITDTTHRLDPIGPTGDYEVTIFGKGGGDLFVSFRWQTLVDGVMPVPAATASILADHDGEIDSYGVELPIWNLATRPESAAAEARVTAADGASHTLRLSRQKDCRDGALSFTAPRSEGLAAAELGSPPFVYEVTLDLDGHPYLGRGTWPDDVDPECSPCVPLTFDPPLPGLSPASTAGVEALQIDGVWVFQHRPDGGADALHGGTAEIVDGCLVVDDAIVVWYADRIEEAEAAIAAVKAGDRPELLIGGGGISLAEGASPAEIPAVITDHCQTSAVWFGSP